MNFDNPELEPGDYICVLSPYGTEYFGQIVRQIEGKEDYVTVRHLPEKYDDWVNILPRKVLRKCTLEEATILRMKGR